MNKSLLYEKVSEIYDWLDLEVTKSNSLSGSCKQCGKCCDFAGFDHLLFITSPEILFFKDSIDKQKIKSMTGDICPYNMDGKCTVYPYRFAACRIFLCNGDKKLQSNFSETAIAKFKSLCKDFCMPYNYTDLRTALNVTLAQIENLIL